MRGRRALTAVAAVVALAGSGCASALRGTGARLESDLGLPDTRPAKSAAAALEEARAAFERRPDLEAVRSAARLFASAALADEKGVEGLLGFSLAATWLVEHEKDAAERERLVTAAVRAGEWCGRRAPGSPQCDYALALALGQQARERPATAVDGLKQMVAALGRAAAGDETQDSAGPHRVLALVLLRAPGWPAGPGDPEQGLEEAKRAAALVPDDPRNQLALGEAFRKNGDAAAAVEAFTRARDLARPLAEAGDPDAREWLDEATAELPK